MIIKSKCVFTGMSKSPEPLSLLIKNNKIQKVLPYEGYSNRYFGEEIKDYGDKLVMPSFVDAHTHIMSGAVDGSEYVCDTLGKCKSQKECVDMIQEYAKAHPDLKRIRGTGWFVGAWNDDPLPDKRSLDRAIPDKAVYLRCADGHSMWLNSKAIEESGYQADFEVEDGEVCRFDDGTLTGLFIELSALAPAMKLYMDFTEEELQSIHENFQKKLASYGIAAVSEMFADDYTKETKDSFTLLKKLDETKGLSTEVFCYTKLFGYTDFTPFFELKKELDSQHFHMAGVKGFIDGVTETYTGLLLEPYSDRPETYGGGVPLWPMEKMQEEIIAANKAGIQVRLHCIADGSVRMALDMYEKSLEANGNHELRNTIEHIENIHKDDIERFRQLHVIPSMQPYHVTLSNNGKVWRLGKERCQLEFPIRTIYEAGGDMAIGTDYPVVQINPFATIYAAFTRCDDIGRPVCRNSEMQKLPMDVIIKAYTLAGARVYHAEERMGTLEEGKMANIIVLNNNLFEITAEEIKETKVIVNYFEGREVYHE